MCISTLRWYSLAAFSGYKKNYSCLFTNWQDHAINYELVITLNYSLLLLIILHTTRTSQWSHSAFSNFYFPCWMYDCHSICPQTKEVSFILLLPHFQSVTDSTVGASCIFIVLYVHGYMKRNFILPLNLVECGPIWMFSHFIINQLITLQ